MARPAAIAVVDIGKSNAKLALVDPATRVARTMRSVANTVVAGGLYPHFDVGRLWQWILQGLAAFAEEADIGAIAVTTHGACFALLAGDRLAMPVLDYEYDGPESLRGDYAAVRGAFSETYSPDLPNGLNAGRQLYWQSRTFPDAFAKVDAILPYPQYWAWKLTGRKVSEVTSLGCHTDLWVPQHNRFSRLAANEGWDRLFPPVVAAWDLVGTLLPEVVFATGLSSRCHVVAGIHDSNASLLPHLMARPKPFAVLSTGTWLVALAPGGTLDRLDPARDCLVNVDPFAAAVPSARFMAGREFELLTGGDDAIPSAAETARVVEGEIMVLPTFAPGTGPFGAYAGRWSVDPATLSAGERAAAASLYCVLVAEICLELAGAEGPVLVEGPFARNELFLRALAQRVGRGVIAEPDSTGTVEGAALLAAIHELPASHDDVSQSPLAVDLNAYRARWRERVAANQRN